MDTTAVQPERAAQPKPAPFHVIELAAGRRQVVVDGYGAFVGKKSERLVVRGRDGECLEVPFHDVERVTIATSGASLSSDAVQACCEEGIQLDFLSSNGHPYAKVTSPTLTATIVTRREQLLGYYDERGVAVVTTIVTCKIRNQANLLKRLARSRRETKADLYDAIRAAAARMEAILVEVTATAGTAAATVDGLRASFLSAEGRAGHIYWDLVGRLVDGKVDFPGREHRGAADPLNVMLRRFILPHWTISARRRPSTSSAPSVRRRHLAIGTAASCGRWCPSALRMPGRGSPSTGAAIEAI
jgi:CRISPR-associated endonuclease Cas1